MGKIATRKSFGQALADFGDEYQNVVCFDADLSKSTMSSIFAKKYPERFFEMGIQEANMIGAAAGMSFTGKIPFVCSFGAFLTGRFDQIRMSVGYSQANVKLVGTHCGVGIGEDGHSQMGLEDVALMRTIPKMTVLQPSGDKECRQMVEWAIKHQGPVYLRLTRQGLKEFDLPSFELSKYPKIMEGERVAFLATGGLLEAAHEAAIRLTEIGRMTPSVYNLNSCKPLDSDFLTELAEKYKEFVVFEDHSIIGGSGAAIAEWMAEFAPIPRRVRRYGVRDTFGESGRPEDLYQKHGFTVEGIVTFFSKND
jgi:transketolase